MNSITRQFQIILVICLLSFIISCGQLTFLSPSPKIDVDNPLVTEVVARGIWIQPIDGTSKPMSKLLSDSIIKGLKLRGIRATKDPKVNSRYRLKSKAVINKEDLSKPHVAVITWTVFDFSDKLIGSEEMGVPGSLSDWYFGSPVLIDEIGKVAPEIISSIINESKETKIPESTLIKPKLWGVWINSVTNAPGDGNVSLTSSIKNVFLRDGIPLADNPYSAQYFLEGNVNVEPSKNGLQKVEIVWIVLNSNSQKVGKAIQKNVVKSGTFSDAWGDLAKVIAEAALPGIKGVIAKHDSSKLQERNSKMEVLSDPKEPILPLPKLDLEGL
ncbi:MAG: hypothetical protein VX923_07460 [Pseudomonadota bacterium]|nr:hypothetical protein [Pseudomonadota bacterium]